MRRLLLLLSLFVFASPLEAGEAMVLRPCVVRSGASEAYYATGQLQPGAVVQVRGFVNDFVAIEPPEGSFSLVPVKNVRLVSSSGNGSIGTIKSWSGAEAIIGPSEPSALLAKSRVEKLAHGVQIMIIDKVPVQTQAGMIEHYRIRPTAKEARYIPRSAIDQNIAAPSAPGGPPQAPPSLPQYGRPTPPPAFAPEPQAQLPSNLPPDVLAQLSQADAAYQIGRRTGDYREAEQRYQELAQSLHHEARMAALNRLEFIRQRKGQPPEQAPLLASRQPQRMNYGPAGGWAPVGSVARQRLPVEPAAALQPQAGQQLPLTRASTDSPLRTANPAPPPVGRDAMGRTTSTGQPAAPPTGDRIPAQTLGAANGNPPPVAAAPAQAAAPGGRTVGPAPQVGTLRRAYQTHFGQPLYYLTDHTGNMKMYITPPRNQSMASFVDKNVQVQGGPTRNDPSLGGKPHLNTTKIELLGK